jgi:DNA-binding NtrC family response regulator
MGREAAGLDPEVLDVLSRYPWPGNVRELQNVLKRSLAMCQQPVLAVEDLPDEVVVGAGERLADGSEGFFALRAQRVAAFEREYLAGLLRATGGDVSQAAREARIPRGTVYRLLKKHDLDPSAFRATGAGAKGSEG